MLRARYKSSVKNTKMIVDGKKIANTILEQCTALPKTDKFCAAFLVGDDPASISFLKQKRNAAEKAGVDFRLFQSPAEIQSGELRSAIEKIVADDACGGAIIQLPLPSHIDRQNILNIIPLEKDVDVLSERALGAFYTGQSKILPPAVGVVEAICADQKYDLSSHSVAIVGLGFLVGRPIANWMKHKAKEIIPLEINSDISLLKSADLVITGVGKAHLIKPEMLKNGAAVIDFGYDSMLGDFDACVLDPDDSRVAFYTPTPGGTGPILVAKLFENFYKLNK